MSSAATLYGIIQVRRNRRRVIRSRPILNCFLRYMDYVPRAVLEHVGYQLGRRLYERCTGVG
jgi:hypothetical protein